MVSKALRIASFASIVMVAFTLISSAPAHSMTYEQWREIQRDRIETARDRGSITQQEAKHMLWEVNHVDPNRFSATWDTWHDNYWREHPGAWHYDENGRWVDGHYVGYPYSHDTLDDIRDIIDHL